MSDETRAVWETKQAHIEQLAQENDALRAQIEWLTAERDIQYMAVQARAAQLTQLQATLARVEGERDRMIDTLKDYDQRDYLQLKQMQQRLAQAEQALNETWTDERDEVWRRPTAWAYAQTCRALHQAEQEKDRLRAENAQLQIDLARAAEQMEP